MSTQLDFQSDPADEIIAATSIVERSPLLTREPPPPEVQDGYAA